MKTFLRILFPVLALLIIGILAFTYFSYNRWSPGEVAFVPDQSSAKYFQSSYVECRSVFRRKSLEMQSRFDSVEVFPVAVASKTDNDLTTDVCYIPAQVKKSRLLIISSGIHGIEGYVGSAVQQMIMEEFIKSELVAETGVLFIHAVNPYGFKNSRRVNEKNIDLNRNCGLDSSLFAFENSGYTKLFSWLNPTGKANSNSLQNRFFLLLAVQKLAVESKKALLQAILEGQYMYHEGLYFGGKRVEPQIQSIASLLQYYAGSYDKVMNIDLHTGYGQMGVLHLFPNPVKDPKIKSALEKIFAGNKIDWGDSDDFYTINGQFADFVGRLLPGKVFLPMTFEYGTLNTKTTMGLVHSLQNMVLENQGFQFGYETNLSKLTIEQNFHEMYYPSSSSWRSKVISDTRKMIESSVSNFQHMNTIESPAL